MSLLLSALRHHSARRFVGTIHQRAFSSSSHHHTRAKPTLTVSRPKKTASSSASPSSSAAKSSPQKPPLSSYSSNLNSHQGNNYTTRLNQRPNLANHSRQHPHAHQSPFPIPDPSRARGVILKAFLAGSLIAAGGLGIYSAVSESEQFRNDLTFIKASLTNPSSSPTTDARAFSTTPALTHSKSSSFQKHLQMLTPEEVESRLAQNQQSFRVAPSYSSDKQRKEQGSLILGYSINQIASNNPIEDDLSRHVIRAKDGSIDKVFFGVFDGHGGWCCSQKVAQELAPAVATELDKVKNARDVMAVMEAIENGFLKLDDKIVNETVQQVLAFPSRPLACSSLLPAISGSCALMAYVDVKEKDLYVACTEPTRAFGDSRYKWSKETQENVFQLFPSYRQPHRNYHTPPYVTAKPVVKHHKLQPEDRFLVMATDGLWDKLTSEEVIQLVGDLLDGKTGKEQTILDRDEIMRAKLKLKAIKAAMTGNKKDQQEEEEELTPADLAPKGPASQIRQFTFKDEGNASTHLVRNALGGGDDDRLAATLSIPAPMSRVYRDDITVTVIFFGEQDTKLPLNVTTKDADGFVEIL
ncbi:hypothetical protein BGZ81_009552 [Podila clonocystis]|nr:hypothetical protein BGZ81_009552 [Podila clonocystis]